MSFAGCGECGQVCMSPCIMLFLMKENKVLHVGFTGTQSGMTEQQYKIVSGLLRQLKPTHAHHGDCVGADADFHNICRSMQTKIQMVGHPPIKKNKRANCEFDILRETKEYLVRNHDIVDESTIMVSTPFGPEELRSGTWSTIRYAKRKKVKLYIVWPDGRIEEH
jgi:hypothetical protein